MAPCFSRAVLRDGVTETIRRRDPAPWTASRIRIRTTPNPNPNLHSSLDMRCLGDHCQCHGCGCGCRSCSCRTQPIQTESNREVYSGEGGPAPSPQNGPLDRASSSINTGHSGPSHNESFSNILTVQDYLNARLTAVNLARHDSVNTYIRQRQTEDVVSVSDEESDNPWPFFVDLADSLDHMSLYADTPGGGGRMNDSSMAFERGGSNSCAMSMLSSQCEASFHSQSVAASTLLKGTGAAFANQFLPLTPECRHARTHPMSRQYGHY